MDTKRKEAAPRGQMKIAVIAILMLSGVLFSSNGWAQTDRASISGKVTDSTGLPIPGVQVSVTDSVKGVSYSTSATNDHGVYRVLNLPVGTYSLSFKKEGFKQYDQSGITLIAAQDAKVDTTLAVGAVAETVTVTANADILDSYTATEATTVTSQALQDLPLSIAGGRNALSFAAIAVPTVQFDASHLGAMVANGLVFSTNVMIDGIDADSTLQGYNRPPGLDAIQELQVQTSGIDAESSQTGGGSFQYELKSGTNQFHGSAFAIRTNEAIDANNWANNYFLGYCAAAGAGSSSQCPADFKKQYRRPNDRLKDYGFSGGGPIWKSHTFIFGAYERYNDNTLAWAPNQTTVPTTKMLGGDFSQLLTNPGLVGAVPACASFINAGNPCPTGQNDAGNNPIYYGAIFNPSNPGHVFAGNIINIPISAQAQKVIGIYKADYAPINGNLTNNFWGLSGATDTDQNLDVKLDQYFSEKNHGSGSVNWSKVDRVNFASSRGTGNLWQKDNPTGGPFASVQGQPQWFTTIHLADAYTITPNLTNNVILAYNWAFKKDTVPAPDGKAFGGSSSYFPVMTFGGFAGEQGIGQPWNDYVRWQQERLKDTVLWVRGRHVLTFGGEYIGYGNLGQNPPGSTTYGFTNTVGMSQVLANNNLLAPFLGSGFANMLLGDPASASQLVASPNHTTRRGFDLFASDQFRATSKLTLNLSLRWDVNGRLHESNGNWSNYNPNELNPNRPAPIMGNIDYLTSSSQSFEKNEDYHLFSPHVGAAYQITPKLVARAAWGLFYVPLGNNTYGGTPYGGSFSCANCFGFNQAPPAPVNVNVLPAFQWDANLYPGVFTPGEKDSTLNQSGGWGQASIDPNILSLGRTQNWNVGVEYGVSKNTVLDVRYMGNKGSALQDDSLYPQNFPHWAQYQPLLLSGHAGDFIWGPPAAAAAGVPWYPSIASAIDHGYGYPAYAAISPSAQSPQSRNLFGGPTLAVGYGHGSSRFNGFVAEVKKRAGSGLTMDMSYTYSRAVQNVTNCVCSFNGGANLSSFAFTNQFQDPYAYNQFTGLISPNDTPHQVKGYIVYNLPFGTNGRWLQQSKALNYLVGGWTLGTDVNYHSGSPMFAVHSTNSYPGWSNVFANQVTAPGNHFQYLDLANLNDVSNQYFSPSSFANPANGQLGNQKPFNSSWRGWAYANEDADLIKHFRFGREGRFDASLRAEFFNVFNRHYWGGPDTGLGSSTFGQVTSVYGNRTGQFGARFAW